MKALSEAKLSHAIIMICYIQNGSAENSNGFTQMAYLIKHSKDTSLYLVGHWWCSELPELPVWTERKKLVGSFPNRLFTHRALWIPGPWELIAHKDQLIHITNAFRPCKCTQQENTWYPKGSGFSLMYIGQSYHFFFYRNIWVFGNLGGLVG